MTTSREHEGPTGASAENGTAQDREGEESRGSGASGGDSGSSWSRGLGILSAVRDALETTINEARDRGDLSPERAREIFGRAASRAREATAEARERLDLVPRSEFDALVRRVRELEDRLEALEGAERGPESDAGGGASEG